MTHVHRWTNFERVGNEFVGTDHTRECNDPHWPERSCGLVQTVSTKGYEDLVKEISDAIEPVLSGQYGREVSDDVALEILQMIQKREPGRR
jgi:hypothetical protein